VDDQDEIKGSKQFKVVPFRVDRNNPNASIDYVIKQKRIMKSISPGNESPKITKIGNVRLKINKQGLEKAS